MFTHSRRFIRRDGAPGFWIDRANYDRFEGHTLALGRSIGYMYDYEILLLLSIVRSLPESAVVVVLGAGVGTSAMGIIEARPDLSATTFTIDVRDDDNPYGGLMNERNAFRDIMPGYSLPNQIKGDTHEIGKTWDKPIDFLFVDADHTRAGVIKDIELWKPHVKHGGFILFHDYDHGFWPDIKPVVDKEMKDDILIAVVDISALYKIK